MIVFMAPQSLTYTISHKEHGHLYAHVSLERQKTLLYLVYCMHVHLRTQYHTYQHNTESEPSYYLS